MGPNLETQVDPFFGPGKIFKGVVTQENRWLSKSQWSHGFMEGLAGDDERDRKVRV